jgi:hypothetical protein
MLFVVKKSNPSEEKLWDCWDAKEALYEEDVKVLQQIDKDGDHKKIPI